MILSCWTSWKDCGIGSRRYGQMRTSVLERWIAWRTNEREHIPGAKAQWSMDLNVRAKARTYLRSNDTGHNDTGHNDTGRNDTERNGTGGSNTERVGDPVGTPR